MAEGNLTQTEADALFLMEKSRINDDRWEYPNLGGSRRIPLISVDGREEFFLDLWRARINLAKGTYQNRARQVVILARLDFGGGPHRSPDGEDIPTPHLHRYREGYGDKWALPIPSHFSNVNDLWTTLEEFMTYCHITQPPIIDRGLF